LSRADLYKAHLEGASLRKAHLEGASLRNAHLEGKYLFPRKQGTRQNENSMNELPPADLRAAFFDSKTDLRTLPWAMRRKALCGWPTCIGKA
jgi:uncharacterized protein YjbI with pentapeptide repeats